MKYEIINPSDKAFVHGDDFKTVCIAIILLGNGKYGLRSEDGKFEMPPVIFATGWFEDHFKESIEVASDKVSNEELKKVLESVHLKGKRTSMNDIVGRAKEIHGYLK